MYFKNIMVFICLFCTLVLNINDSYKDGGLHYTSTSSGNDIQFYTAQKYNMYPLDVDLLIEPAVKILNEHGFKTFESCQGGEGHCFSEPTVRFYGLEFDLIRAYEILSCYGLNVHEAKRVFIKEDIYKGNKNENELPFALAWGNPFNEITFVIHSLTGTIFLPH